jgi:SAM-dependent methyltransferase
MPDGARLASFYPADYHSLGRRGWLANLRSDMRIRRLTSQLSGDGPILDHGCGDGSFLVRAAERMPGRKLYGYEISDRCAVTELVAGRVTIIRGSDDDLFRLLPECRLITMNHVIEHLPDPLATLSKLRSRLLAGGVLEGQTPAAGSLEHRVFGGRWSGYHAPRHTVVFSRSGLATLLTRAGLSQVEVSGAFNPAGVAVSLASMLQPAAASGRIARSGPLWLFWLGLAATLAPLDLFFGAPGIVDFRAKMGLS